MRVTRLIIPALLAGGGVGYWLWAGWQAVHPAPVVLSGTIECDDIALGTKVGGHVVEVLADEGDWVTAGQVLVRLDRAQLEAERAQAEALLAESRARLAELENGSRPEDIAAAEAAVAQRRAVLDRLLAGSRREEIERARAEWQARVADLGTARATLERLRPMGAEGVISQQALDDAQGRVEAAAAQAEAARQQYEAALAGPRVEEIEEARAALAAAEAARARVTAGPRSEEIAAVRAQVAQREAQIARIDADLDETVIEAPSDAVIEVLDLEPGDLLAANQIVATLLLPDALWVRVYIPEDRLGWVSVGQEVEVRVDTWPREVFRGTVDQINRRAEFTPRNVQTVDERVRQVFGVRVRLDNSSDRLRAGMAADVTIRPPRGGEAAL